MTVAFLVAVGAAESGRPTVMFQAREAVRPASAVARLGEQVREDARVASDEIDDLGAA